MSFNIGKGHLLGRDIVYQDLNAGSLLVGEGLEVKELSIGGAGQVLTVVAGSLQWQTPSALLLATGQNLGAGARVLSNVTAGHSQFRTLTAGVGMIINESTNEISFDVDLTVLAGLPSSSTIGLPSDGSLTDPIFPGAPGPAIPDWTVDLPVADALDGLNELLGLLVPSQPPDLEDITISMTGGGNTRAGANILLASGVTNNTGTAPIVAGTQIFRVTNALASTAVSPGFGPGNTGTLSATVNGVVDGSIALAQGDDSNTNGSLVLLSDVDFPLTTPGFWEELTATVTSTVSVGVNRYQLNHDVGGDSNELFFVHDDFVISPNVSNIMIVEGPGNPPNNFSSGIPHLAGGSVVNVTATVDNLSGNTYLSEGVIQISGLNLITSSGSLGDIVNIDPGTFNIPTILSKSETPKTVTAVPFITSSSTFVAALIQVRGRNAQTDGALTILQPEIIINALSNIPSNKIDELNVNVTSGTVPSGAKTTAERVLLGVGDNPDTTSADSLLDAGWDSTSVTPAHEASVVGGTLKNDTSNYSLRHIPPGPNYAGHQSNQYSTWFFRRSTISSFQITIQGSYVGLWVTMADVDFGVAPNGWLDMGQLYAGAGIPGQNGSDGCALGTAATGQAGTFTCTFGPATSSSATNNIIMVRIRLDSSQQITTLSF